MHERAKQDAISRFEAQGPRKEKGPHPVRTFPELEFFEMLNCDSLPQVTVTSEGFKQKLLIVPQKGNAAKPLVGGGAVVPEGDD